MIRNTSEGVVGHYAKPLKPSDSLLCDNSLIASYVTKEVRFFNGTKYDLTVVDRTGVRIIIKRYPGLNNSKFIAKTTWCIRRDQIDNFLIGMEGYQYLNNEELNYLMQHAINSRRAGSRFQDDVRAVLEYEVHENEFSPDKQSMYMTNLDVVVSTTRLSNLPAHPFTVSTVGMDSGRLMGDFDDIHNATIKLVYIDNTKKRGDRYVNLCGQIQKLVPKIDVNNSDGIYIYTREQEIDAPESHYIKKNVVSVEDAEKVLGIYKTYEEAQYGGDPKNGIKLAILEAESSLTNTKNELAKKNLELERLTTESKAKELEYKTLRDDLQRTHDLLKASEENRKLLFSNEIITRKHEYDMKSLERKDYSDLVKFVPGLVIAFGAVVAAVLKVKN